ncbi:serine/threonine protein phosphatase [Pseudomonas sp. SWI6]|uniref:phosphatase PAP2/dual specificity phosphatase family protein n=1 Tax=Pseudomonas sp. SWI6 TaxID=2083051 RepID=UPI000CE5DC80|nr:phosphatase PAP2/dual specificity phosphatase family protein [Pseudomonas sp. SWI6]AVD84845.1 serine/threonine protein phosphatase [Pseudomonas sp. SWI6]
MKPMREPGLIRRGVLWLLLLGPVFFLSYGLANSHTEGRDDVGSLVFAWERHIPLWPWTILPYWSIDLLYGLSFLLPRTRREMDRHALALLTAQVISVSCFLLWPLRFTFERPAMDGLFGWLFEVLMGFDKPFNQAPSLHIALLVIIWTMFARHLHRPLWRWVMHGWMALIGVSVLTTWQHHFIDLPTGALSGFACLWLWPPKGQLPWQHAHLAREPYRWRLALRYGAGAMGSVVIALLVGGAGLWLLWPAVALLLVTLNYAALGAQGFQKGDDGRLSIAASALLAPYTLAAWINSRLWTWRHPNADAVCDGVFLGRIPGQVEASSYAAIVDLCAELPCPMTQGVDYHVLATLDLIAPNSQLLQQAASAIERSRHQGPLLVCCALGYSRSASAVAAWLLLTGRCSDIAQAQVLIRKARQGVVLSPAHRLALQRLGSPP